jgi:hypothetical protein
MQHPCLVELVIGFVVVQVRSLGPVSTVRKEQQVSWLHSDAKSMEIGENGVCGCLAVIEALRLKMLSLG